MLGHDWMRVEGYSNMGEDYDYLVAQRTTDGIAVAYAAFGGLKVIELEGAHDVADCCLQFVDEIFSECGDDWEIAIPLVVAEQNVMCVVDSCSEVKVLGASEKYPINIICTGSDEYDADTMDELDKVLLTEFDFTKGC